MILDANLYEFYGILLGDGCISKYTYRSRLQYEIRIDGSAFTDVDYYHVHVVDLLSKIIGKRPTPCFRKQCMGIYIHFYNPNLAHFLNESFGFPFGKKGEIAIHPEILKDFELLKHVIRGLFDTDGSLYFTKNNSSSRSYPIIEITTFSSILLDQLMTTLTSMGFVVKINHRGDSIKLHGKKNLLKWMQLIGTNHPDKSSKFKYWEKYGYCPKNNELSYGQRLNIVGP